jgi:hypothetical protein
VILLAGIPSETPLRLVARRLEDAGADFIVLNQRDFADSDIWFQVNGENVSVELRIGGRTWPLEQFRAAHPRLMDDRCLPELENEPEGSAARGYCRSFDDTLTRWMEIAPGRVVNRCAPMASNGSKPYQTQLIRRHGFVIPETLTPAIRNW